MLIVNFLINNEGLTRTSSTFLRTTISTTHVNIKIIKARSSFVTIYQRFYIDVNRTFAEEQQAQNSSMEQEVETSREGSSAPLAGNVSAEPHADDSDDSL